MVIFLEKGEITKIEEIKSPSESLTKAAIHMLQKSPKWKPAKLNGKRLDCPMQIQVVFKLK